MTITKEEAQACVAEIKVDLDGDDEAQHAAADRLHVAALKAIASRKLTGLEAAALAEVVLQTEEIDFCRWFA